MKCLAIKNFLIFLTILNPKIISETLCIITIKKPGTYHSTFLFDIILCFSLRKDFFFGIPSPANVCSKSTIEH